MKIPEAREHLTKQEMDQVTEEALKDGPFAVLSVKKLNGKKEVVVWYPSKSKKRTIVLGE